MSDSNTRQPLSRAEQLRQKRQPVSRTPVLPAKKSTPEPVRFPVTNPFGKSTSRPVQPPAKQAAVITTRSTPYTTPLRQTVTTPMRRKTYRVAENGVETRLPALPIIHFSWQWVSGFLTVALFTVVLLMINLNVFEVNKVQVDGLQRIAVEDVLNVVLNNTDSIFILDRQKVINAIGLTFPDLTYINLKVESSGIVHITAQERQPIIVWYAGDTITWIDSEGILMTPRGEPGPLLTIQSDGGIPVTKPMERVSSAVDYANMILARQETPLTPQDLINSVNPVVLKAALDLSAQMPSGAALVYDPISGMGWHDPRGWKVYFGLSLEDIQFKQVEYQAIVDRLSQIGITPKTISVEHIDAPFYRME